MWEAFELYYYSKEDVQAIGATVLYLINQISEPILLV